MESMGGSNPSNLIASASGQVLAGSQKQMQMTQTKFAHNSGKTAISHKDVNIISGSQGGHGPHNDNLLSPKEYGFLSSSG